MLVGFVHRFTVVALYPSLPSICQEVIEMWFKLVNKETNITENNTPVGQCSTFTLLNQKIKPYKS